MITTKDLVAPFQGKRVLVTGHTGFKGSWLCTILDLLGADVFGYSLAEPVDKRHSYYALNTLSFIKNPQTHIGDVRDLNRFRDEFVAARPDYIFHLAAQPIVSISYTDPYLTFSSNILGVLNALEILKAEGSQTTAVIITSDKCYKNKEQAAPYIENDEMGGDDPYSASKGAAELVFHSYSTSFPDLCQKYGLASVRAGNVFGGGDWSTNRLIPDCARELFSSQSITIRMPKAVRPWTFVVDILFGYLMLAANLRDQPAEFRGSWNFASRETKTVREVVELFIERLGFGKLIIDEASAFGKEAGLLLIDPAKAEHKLGWRPKFSVAEALAQTADWYRDQHQGEHMANVSHTFIKDNYL
jgi:CDP-glucose 4,6-dehydratase